MINILSPVNYHTVIRDVSNYLLLKYVLEALSNFYLADIRQSTDYSPFGVILDKRDYRLTDPVTTNLVVRGRFGFNGMEMDNELKLDGNSYTTEFRQYDPRLGRWLSLDPAAAKYPGQSPYVAFNNNPLFFTDPFGDDPPEGFKSVEGQGGDLSVPESTKLIFKTVKVGEETLGGLKNETVAITEERLESFQIGSRTFSAGYDDKGNFSGYFDGSEKYENPDISFSSGYVSGGRIDLAFNISNVPADGLEVIQTIVLGPLNGPGAVDMYKYVTGGVPTVDEHCQGTLTWTSNGISYEGQVDGGNKSFYADSYIDPRNPSLGKCGPVYPNSPYYIGGPPSVAGLIPSSYTNSGKIFFNDNPTAKKVFSTLDFQSIIVARNYMKTGKDLILGTVNWGFSNYGASSYGSTSIKGNTPTENSYKIILDAYPGYEFFK